jgi:dihydrolipoyl dehydrogenase
MIDTQNLLVIGGGPAGVAAALIARSLGATVTVVESTHLGGTCLNAGCVPSAALHRAAYAKRDAQTAERFGISVGNITTDWLRLQGWAGSAVKAAGSFSRTALEEAGIPVIDGAARFVGPGHIETADRGFQNMAVVIATGARSAPPLLPGKPARPPLTNDGVLALDHTPARVMIIGAGRFSLEWADFLHAMGSKVTVVCDSTRVLPGEDADLAGFLQLVLEERGVRFLLGEAVENVDGDHVRTSGGDLVADAIVCADERIPNTAGLGLDTAGLAVTDAGALIVDEHLHTTAEGVFAAGDVTGPPWLTNRATLEGVAAARNALGDTVVVNRARIPRSVNTDPPLAAVGLTVEQATATGQPATLRMFDLALSPRAITLGDPRGALKLVIDEDTGQILGGHMVGPHATDVIAQLALAIEAEIDYRKLASTFVIHPSMSEAIAQAIRFGPAQ